jgi:hypothetical protein
MQFSSLFDADPPSWQTWAIPAAGMLAALLSLVVGRLIFSRSRSRGEAAADKPTHDPFDQGSVTERRGSARRKGNVVEVLVTGSDTEEEPARGWVVDRSMGGLCLTLNEEVAPGTVLNLKPRNGPPATPWVEVEVRSCKKDRSGYEVGCQFIRTPPWAVLLLFG